MLSLALSLWFGSQFIFWGIKHWSELYADDADPVATLVAVWVHFRWPLGGIGLFAVSWFWALLSSLGFLSEARRQSARSEVPPVISGGN